MSGSDVVFVLDRPAYVGRNPVLPRIAGAHPPRLVRVASPRGEVSSSHIEVRQLGATVVVTDLKSTNGSIVVSPGQEARALRQGESMVVSPGTLVDIGDGNVIEITPLHQVD
jgi:pSer/pThr/pTyr-binding forkhead associated (FHA) protein